MQVALEEYVRDFKVEIEVVQRTARGLVVFGEVKVMTIDVLKERFVGEGM